MEWGNEMGIRRLLNRRRMPVASAPCYKGGGAQKAEEDNVVAYYVGDYSILSVDTK